MKNVRALAELTQKNGEYQFRLLSLNLKQIEIDELKITLDDAIFAFEPNSEGKISEVPFVRVTIHTKNEQIKAELNPNQPICEIKGWHLLFRYAFSAEVPPYPNQTLVYFSLKHK